MIVGEGGLLAGIGVLVALPFAVVARRFASSLLFDPRPFDAGVIALVAFVLLGLGVVASLVPARRAARLDPLQSLRHE
jgi:putative ABC transport system permease protein